MKNILFDIISKLTDENIDFVICGGVACFLQGCERTTYDLDINLSMEENNIEKTISLFKKLGFTARIPEPMENLKNEIKRKEWVEKKGALVYTVNEPKGLFQIDIFLTYPISYEELKRNADVFDIDNKNILVSSAKDLIIAKKSINPLRDKDIFDLKQLEAIENGKL
ncbi:MAG TPA: hypothetical protein PK771_08075 [Spirochaetota bacterium]|nr:hypothetical protein [Spirochaetota bacterium]